MRVLIVGTRSPYTLDLIRSFGQSDYHVYGADFIEGSVGSYSRYLRGHYTLCSPVVDFDKFKEQVIRLDNKLSFDLIIPTNEEVFYFSKLKDLLGERLFCESLDFLKELHSKEKFVNLCKSSKLKVPHTTRYPDTTGHNDRVILKPEFSRFGHNVQIANIKTLPKLEGDWLVQEKVLGREFCLYSVFKQGRMTAFSAYEKSVCYGNGAAVYFKHSDIPDLKEWIKILIGSKKLTGQFSFDVFLDGNDEIIGIECNPRATSGIHLFDSSQLWKAFVDKDKCLVPLENAKGIKLAMLLTAKGRKEFWKTKGVIFSVRDVMPFFMQWRSMIKFFILSRLKSVPLVAAMTLDIEFNG